MGDGFERDLDRLHGLLMELYTPAGVLLYVSAPNRLIDGSSVSEAINSRDTDKLNKVIDTLDAVAGGAFL